MKDNYLQHRETPLAEALLSLIITLTIMSWLLIIRATDEFVATSPVAQYIPLILVLIHFVIRRKVLNLLPCFVTTVVASALFYLVLVLIPVTGYGCCGANMFYLGANVFAFTVFSVQYRLRPLLKAGDTNLLLFAVLSLPPFGILYFFTMRHDIFNLFISNSVASAVIYLFLRQFAIFESRYYHSISKSSVPLKQLKKQNYMTGIYLSEFFLILFLLLTLVPLLIFSNFVSDLFASILPVIFTAIFAFINFLGSLFLGNDTIATPEEGNYLRERSEDQPWVFVLSYILVVVMIMIAIHVIPKAIRMIIQNAPKYRKFTSETDDGIIVDTIEDISPDQKIHKARYHDFGEGHEYRIRKKFYTKTRRAMRDGLPVSSSSTPGQIETALLANGDDEISELRKEYENVRYSK
ncbi:MAG: hypothetical protein II585_02175 [Clostridiales bacterium]|nr:hypothetical protein [Clostridiales bacterium]